MRKETIKTFGIDQLGRIFCDSIDFFFCYLFFGIIGVMIVRDLLGLLLRSVNAIESSFFLYWEIDWLINFAREYIAVLNNMTISAIDVINCDMIQVDQLSRLSDFKILCNSWNWMV